ncbi:MAG: hypothetical protein AB1345_04840 [Chloroflexota bacterium]
MDIKEQPSILKMVLVSIPILLLGFYFMVALNTGDLLWFWPAFEEHPSGIIIYCYGQEISLEYGSEAFERLTTLINEILSGRKRWDPLSMSDVTYQEYQTSPNMMTLALRFNPSVRIHSFYKFFSGVDTLIIPLDGRHAQTNAVFGQRSGKTTAGSLHVNTISPLIEYIQEQSLCLKP